MGVGKDPTSAPDQAKVRDEGVAPLTPTAETRHAYP